MGIRRFKEGQRCKTIGGSFVHVVKLKNRERGYETALFSDGVHRYNRSTHEMDQGRVTGSPHDWSDNRNIDPICIGIDRSKFDEAV